MENWDFSVLTGASLIPPTENKRCSYFFLVYHFFRTEASLDLKYHPIPFLCQKVWIWMTTNILLVSLGSERLSVRLACKGSIHFILYMTLVNGPFSKSKEMSDLMHLQIISG